MTWQPADYTGACQSKVLTFLTFLAQYLGHSHDTRFTYPREDKIKFGNMVEEEYDFIIVGAGSAGCVVANRLSEIEDWKIMLLEAGDEEPVVAGIPGLWPILRDSNIDYKYSSEEEPVICRVWENNVCPLPRGKVMGGTSTINDMMYMRGNKQDFDDWYNLGNTGWSYEDVLPYFKKSEDARDATVVDKNPESHAKGGYLTVERYPQQSENTQTIIDAWKEFGLKEVDYNAGAQVGVSRVQYTSVHGARLSANGAFIRPIRGRRPNLTIQTNSRVIRVLIDPSNRAFGVILMNLKTNQLRRMYARKEVIISAGAFDSPKLLMLSGIGPSDHLRKANITVIKDSKVGYNLHEHTVVIPFKFQLRPKSKVIPSFERINNDLVYWLSTHEGVLSSTGLQSTVAFYQTSFENREGVPDIQAGFAGLLSDKRKCYQGFSKIATSYYDQALIYLVLLKPKSRGYVKLNITDPVWSQPLIRFNSLTNIIDLERFVEGIRIARNVTITSTLRKNGFTRIMQPGCEEFPVDSNHYFMCLASRWSFSSYHPVGTCKMGPAYDKEAVVDPNLKVYGIKGLRVIDGSIMPVITSGGINAPIIMIGEKGSDLIKKDWL